MMCAELPEQLVSGRERGRAGNVGRKAAQQRQRAEIASEDIYRQNNILFPACLVAAPQASSHLPLARR